MAITVTSKTTYPERIDEKRSRWEGTITVEASYPEAFWGDFWYEPAKYFKQVTYVNIESYWGFKFWYYSDWDMLMVFEKAGDWYPGGMQIPDIKFYMEGLHV